MPKVKIFSFLFLAGSLASPTCASINRKAQQHPATYNGKADRHAFESHEKLHMSAANQQIPALCDEAIRVATFNVHYFKDLHAKNSNLAEIVGDVKVMNPTVVIMEEVVDKGADRDKLDQDLEAEGFKYRAEGFANGAWLGNVIYSRLPLTDIRVTQLGHSRTMIKATIGEGTDVIHLYGTHLEVSSGEHRLKQAKSISKEMNLSGKSLLAGDMNDQAHKPAIQHLTTNGLTDSFVALKWPAATYTCWAGTTIDFLLLSNSLKSDILGSYVYHSLTSDHLPVIVDIRMSKEAQGRAAQVKPEEQLKKSTSVWKWIFLAAGCIILLLVVGLLVWHFCLRKPNSPVLPK